MLCISTGFRYKFSSGLAAVGGLLRSVAPNGYSERSRWCSRDLACRLKRHSLLLSSLLPYEIVVHFPTELA